MADTKRVPTELEAKFLLREVDRRMKDDATISDHASARARGPMGRLVGHLTFALTFVAAVILLPFLDPSVPSVVWMILAALLALVADHSLEIGRLTRVTAALARAAERTRSAEPLPRAPSPPAADPR